MTDVNPQNKTVSELELLTCSASDYAASQGKNLNIYRLVGLRSKYDDYDSPANDLIEKAKRRGCEVVVDIRAIPGSDEYYTLIGTGLIVKKDEP